MSVCLLAGFSIGRGYITEAARAPRPEALTILSTFDIIMLISDGLCRTQQSGQHLPKGDVHMKKKIKRIAVIAAAVLLAAGSIALYGLHRHQMKALRNDLTLEYEKEKHMEERIEAIRKERDSLNGEKQAQSDTIKDQSDKIEELEQKAKEMADQIDELLTEEVTVFDAGAVMEEIQNISELATVEYRYTNVGTLDASKKFSFIDWKVPFSDKTVIVTMDGKIKAGTDLSQVKITGNEWKKEITVSMPEASILSNELFEKSFKIYEEKDSVWNPITLTESNELRIQIKEKAEQNAIDNQILEQADDRAKQLIQSVIEAGPNIKGNYKIKFQALS